MSPATKVWVGLSGEIETPRCVNCQAPMRHSCSEKEGSREKSGREKDAGPQEDLAPLGLDSDLVGEAHRFGVRAAHAAGMTVIQVPDMTQPTADLRSLGHIVLASLNDVAGYPFTAENPHG